MSYNLRKGMSETKIAETLGVSRQTVVRDVKFLKNNSQDWLDGLARDGFIFEYKLVLDNLKEFDYELAKLYSETSDERLKLDILKTRADHKKVFLELLGETPTVYALRKATRVRNVQAA